MKQSFVAQLVADHPVDSTFLVQSKEKKTAQSGSPYLDLELRDSTGVIKAKLWDCQRHSLDFEVDEVVRVARLEPLLDPAGDPHDAGLLAHASPAPGIRTVSAATGSISG